MAGPPPFTVLDRLPGTPIAVATGAGHAISPPPRPNALAFTPVMMLKFLAIAGGVLFLPRAISAAVSLASPAREIALGAVLLTIVVGVATTLVMRSRVRRGLALDSNTRFPTLPDAAARIGVVGREDQLAALIRSKTISDLAFEPAVFDAAAMLPMTGRQRWTYYGCLGVGGLILLVITRGGRSTPPLLAAACAVSLAAFFTPLIWPRTARLVPGRLDMLTCSFLGGRIVECRSYDLRTPVILVDLRAKYVLMASSDGTQTRLRFPTRNPDAFVAALLSAAISTAPAAPLPEDALVG